MTYTIDTENKILFIDAPINLKKAIKFLKKVDKENWSEYSLQQPPQYCWTLPYVNDYSITCETTELPDGTIITNFTQNEDGTIN